MKARILSIRLRNGCSASALCLESFIVLVRAIILEAYRPLCILIVVVVTSSGVIRILTVLALPLGTLVPLSSTLSAVGIASALYIVEGLIVLLVDSRVLLIGLPCCLFIPWTSCIGSWWWTLLPLLVVAAACHVVDMSHG